MALLASLAKVVKILFGFMQALEFLALVLVNLALTIYLVEKGTKFWKEKRRLERLVNQHPEMKGVHPDEGGLFVFESDDSLKVLVLENDQPGSDEPFYVREEDLEED